MLAATASLLPTVSPALAAESGAMTAQTFILPVGTPVPSPASLRSPGALRSMVGTARTSTAATTPKEVVGPAAAYGKRATVRAATAPINRAAVPTSLAAGTVSYPEPARSMTLDECKQNMGGTAQVYIKSRFAVCTALQVTTIWATQKGSVGTSTYYVYIRGSVPKEADRTMSFDYDVTGFTAVGTTGVAGLKIGLKGVVPESYPSTAKPVVNNALPVTKTWPQMQAAPHYTHTLRYAPGQGTGSGAADAIFAVYQPEITSTLPAGWVGTSPATGKPFMFAPRWDSASYLRNSTGAGNPANKGGAVFSVMATLEYSSQPGAPEKAVADHIKSAFTNPKATKPLNALKDVPGDTIDQPLNRLYLDKTRADRNRAVAVRECKRYWGDKYTDGGKECDEFPFASTYQGSAIEEYDVHVERNNYSVMPLDGTQNGAAGNLLAGFYTNNRMIDGPDDGFIVKIS
ncbi:hypothetical protein ACFRCI_30575 [Streptomyces sp. NPDC056638]|uniref:NucA/NucB deoxyribonuclease domain-containing protein n=1 Tax=unclassified Streptomyces TaxID=2593676 RepID=UPI0036B261C2